MKCPQCQQDNPPRAKFCLDCGASFKGPREGVRHEVSNADLQRALSEALEQQAATSEILRVISESPTDIQPVFDTIVQNAVRLCAATFGGLQRIDGDRMTLDAQCGVSPDELAILQRDVFPLPISRESATGRAVCDQMVIHIHDIREDPDFGLHRLQTMRGFRTILAVPMLRKGVPIGALALWRRDVHPFSDTEIRLVQTFAAQAVIAIENVRLFTELQASNTDLTRALNEQTATSDILRVISQSQTDVQPVFEAILSSAIRLIGAFAGVMTRVSGDCLELAAYKNSDSDDETLLRSAFPLSVRSEGSHANAIRDRAPVNHRQAQTGGDVGPVGHAIAQAAGYQSMVVVPLLHREVAVGTISAVRREPGGFADDEIALLRTFADQAVIAIENVRLFTELQASNRELTTALDTQTATSDILRVISRSQTDVQPVFDAILASAVRLLGAYSGGLTRVAADQIKLVALTSIDDVGDAAQRARYPQPLQSEDPHAQAIRNRAPLNIADAQTDPRLDETAHAAARARGFRGLGAVPMLRHDEAIGAITVSRREPGGFTDDEIALLQTFADQAVIAIENARLLTELQQQNEALTQAHAQVTEALEQQTATSEILKIISASPTDVQPVFDAIAANARRLLRGHTVAVTSLAGGELQLMSYNTMSPAADAVMRAFHPILLDRVPMAARTVRERTPAIVSDIETDPAVTEEQRAVGRARGFGSFVYMPMVRDDVAIGMIAVTRQEPGRFTDGDIALLKTFADQAVIAIENVRLFTELRASNRELTTALDTQTATSDILRVISRSQTDVQPVFDAIVQSAVRLLSAYSGALTRLEGEQIHLVTFTGVTDAADATMRAAFPQSIHSAEPHALVVRERVPMNIADTRTDARLPEATRSYTQIRGYRSWVVVPLIRHAEGLGAIGVTRREPGGFTDDEIALLQTFADQAVIAIENVRLFTELQARTQELTRSVGQLTALGEVGRAVSSTLDLETVLSTIVSRAIQLSGTDGGSVYEYDEATEEFSLRASRDLPEAYVEQVRDTRPRKGEGAVGRVAQTREPVQIVDISDATAYESRVRDMLLKIGLRALLAVPLIAEERLVGALIVMRKRTGTFSIEEVALLQTFATQSALAIQNARLFREIEEKSRQLEVASQHKSEFLANMSHELRTPLNAIIGFSEVLGERMFGELNEKQDEYLKDIHASGQHLLSLINDILDLSKIEAGRMELELTDFNLPATLDNALTLVRERAGRRGIALGLTVDERLEQIRADERKVRQVVLNLLSNAIKFTPEGGRIDVRAVPVDGSLEISVTDAGVGIAPEDQEAIFEEFKQVGTAAKKVEGTGLGLALSRKFIELHGGRIWVESEPGAGSTFTFTLPRGPA